MRTLCTGVWILVEKISCADHIFLGSDVYFPSEKTDKKQSKTNKQTKTT